MNKKIDVSSRNYDVSRKHIPGFMVTDINKTIIKGLSYISNIIKEVADKGGDQSKIVSVLSTLPRKTLIKAIEDNDNIYYSKLALAEQDRNGVKLVDIPRSIVDNVRKKTHFGYQNVINKRKDKIARQTKTESFLSELNKKKHT